MIETSAIAGHIHREKPAPQGVPHEFVRPDHFPDLLQLAHVWRRRSRRRAHTCGHQSHEF